MTINFVCTGCDPREAVKAFAKIRQNHFGKWTARHLPAHLRHEATGAYAFENVRDDQPFLTMEPGADHNVHVHWVIHLPPGQLKIFEEKLWRWVERCCGGITDGKVIRITERPAAVMRSYVLAGCDPKWAEIYRVTAEPQGIIVGGRRSGTTENLARKRRIERDRQEKKVRLLPYQGGSKNIKTQQKSSLVD
ncbi:hypothetical protein ELH27_37105 [Rhizobium leguminosarum]|uniref:Replication protein n=1 Tax=Rhizobium beringeri TaxID=3019934 RepID=A0ABY1XHN0_9HYPH|nr:MULTISPECIES: hypothetical protein [Rhizobium]TBC53788.1 hypothetical protein ELH27_37105 [Rhizobium leguminosarum]TBE57574.1 hypothetical protein ELH03_36940 [Rhizobium beringeri]